MLIPEGPNRLPDRIGVPHDFQPPEQAGATINRCSGARQFGGAMSAGQVSVAIKFVALRHDLPRSITGQIFAAGKGVSPCGSYFRLFFATS
jgi:hypothetical protein